MTEKAARRLVFAVLEEEYRAHKPLWQGTLGFAIAAAMTAGLFLDEGSALERIACVVNVLALLYMIVLLALRHELMLRSNELPEHEIPAFRRGIRSGVLLACAPAVLAIIVCTTLFVL